MARQLSTREYGLIVVLLAIGIYLLFFRGGGGFGAGAREQESRVLEFEDAPVVRISRLAIDADAFDAQGRDLFKYYVPPPPPRAVTPDRETRAAPQPKKPTRRMQPQRSAARSDGGQAPKPTFDFIGFLGPKGAKIAVFEESDSLMLARRGEAVQEVFRVVDFKYDAVVLGYTDRKYEGQTTELKMTRK
jgi:hypothetical protein